MGKRIYLPRGARVTLLWYRGRRRIYQRPNAKGMGGKVLVRQWSGPKAIYMVKWDDGAVSFEPITRLKEVTA